MINEDLFIHLVMRFPGTETRIKKNKKTCVQGCVVNPQMTLWKWNTRNGIGLNVFFLVGTMQTSKHIAVSSWFGKNQIKKKRKLSSSGCQPVLSVTLVSQEVIQQLIVLFHIKAFSCSTYNKFKYLVNVYMYSVPWSFQFAQKKFTCIFIVHLSRYSS